MSCRSAEHHIGVPSIEQGEIAEGPGDQVRILDRHGYRTRQERSPGVARESENLPAQYVMSVNDESLWRLSITGRGSPSFGTLDLLCARQAKKRVAIGELNEGRTVRRIDAHHESEAIMDFEKSINYDV